MKSRNHEISLFPLALESKSKNFERKNREQTEHIDASVVMMNEWSYPWEASYIVLDGHIFACYAAVTETRNKLVNVCNRHVNNQLSIGRRQTRISCSLFIKMTDIIIFFEFLLSRLWDLFSFHLPLYIQVRFAHYLFCFEHPYVCVPNIHLS
jgi:hypothetical protein